jgi:predicted nucleic acid-binding protein
MLLDTQFLIALERELDAVTIGPARRFLGSRRSAPVLVSTVSIGELAAGMNTNDAARRLVSRFRRVNLFTEVALAAADIDRQLIGLGLRLGENDTWLAGTARYYGVPIVSNDTDFDRVPGLRCLRY